jgi:hypothetical protein
MSTLLFSSIFGSPFLNKGNEPSISTVVSPVNRFYTIPCPLGLQSQLQHTGCAGMKIDRHIAHHASRPRPLSAPENQASFRTSLNRPYYNGNSRVIQELLSKQFSSMTGALEQDGLSLI